MSVDQAMRAEVYLALETIHGKDVANAIMEMLPPAGVPELATKQDLALMSAELRTELKGEMAALGERMERLLREQTSRYIGWLLGVAGVGVAAAGAIAGLA